MPTPKSSRRGKALKIVITGGPSAGKTTVANILKKEYGETISIAPEAASILFQGGLPRGDDAPSKIFQQRAIYHLQAEIEDFVCSQNPKSIVVCDRGSLDGLAYWPQGARSTLFRSLKTTEARELRRYDWVIHLDTAGRDGYKLVGVRREDFDEARRINARILHAWRNHPKRVVIPNSTDFSKKISTALNILSMIIEGRSCAEICESM